MEGGGGSREWRAARLSQLRNVKDARASSRTLRITEAPDAAFARKKLAELRAKVAKSNNDQNKAATPAPALAAAAIAQPGENDMLARRLLARLPRDLAASWLKENAIKCNPVLPQVSCLLYVRDSVHTPQ